MASSSNSDLNPTTLDWAALGHEYAEKALNGGWPQVQSPQYALSGAFTEMAREIERLRILATPPASDAAVLAGMKPWDGNGKPDDYDGGPALQRNGKMARRVYDWGHYGASVADGDSDIIAYTAAAPKVASDTGAITPEWCLRMAELEAGQEIGAGALDHPLRTKCELPPAGRVCIRTPGHDGPCAAVASDTGAGLRAHERLQAAWDSVETLPAIIFSRQEATAILKALVTPTDATDGATGGGEVLGDDEIIAEFAFLYRNYGAAPDSILAPDAIELKRKVLAALTPGGDLLEQADDDAL